MNRRELLTGAAVLAGVTQANAFGLGKEGRRGGFGSGGALGKAGVSGPVAIDAVGTNALFNNVTSFSNTGITVGSGRNRALIVVLAFGNTGLTVPSGITCTWDGVAMTQLYNTFSAKTNGSNSEVATVVFGLVNPNSGNKTLAGSWTSSQCGYVCGMSFTGVNQGGAQASFPNGTFANSSGGANPTVPVNCPANGYVIGVLADNANPTMNNTLMFYNPDGIGPYGAANYATSTVDATFNLGATAALQLWSMSAVAVAPVPAPAYWVYEDWSRYPDGATINGAMPVEGPAWGVTGAATVSTSAGKLVATSAGSVYVNGNVQATPSALSTLVAFNNVGDITQKVMTIAYAASSIPFSLNDLLHLNFGPLGFTLTVRQAGGAFVGILSGSWNSQIIAAGTVTLAANGNTATVTGPSGETFQVTDARISTVTGGSYFFEPAVAADTLQSFVSKSMALR